MIRNSLGFVLIGLAFGVVGCAKSNEPPQRAQTALGGLMPAEQPGFDAAYVSDQKDVKIAGPREVSYDPLSSFREKNAEAAKAKAGATKAKYADPSEETAKAADAPKAGKDPGKSPDKAKVAKKSPRSGKPGLVSRMKNAALGKLGPAAGLLQGKGGAAKPAKAEPAKKEKDKKKAKAEDEEEEGDTPKGKTDEGGAKGDEGDEE